MARRWHRRAALDFLGQGGVYPARQGAARGAGGTMGPAGNLCAGRALLCATHLERSPMPRLARPLLLASLLSLLAACETFEGFGRDVQTTGAVITEEAQEAQ
jgi:predicted small secreted protein